MKKIKNIINIFIIIIALIVCSIILSKREQLLENANIRYLVIKSGSMQPTLNIKDIVLIKKQDSYMVGDIITYKDDNNNLITHRIIEKQGNSFITKGDNNNVEDQKSVSINNVKGKVILIINKNILIISMIIIEIIVIYIIWKGNKK